MSKNGAIPYPQRLGLPTRESEKDKSASRPMLPLSVDGIRFNTPLEYRGFLRRGPLCGFYSASRAFFMPPGGNRKTPFQKGPRGKGSPLVFALPVPGQIFLFWVYPGRPYQSVPKCPILSHRGLIG